MKHIGLHSHRFVDNPAEKRFADAWREHQSGRTLDYLLLCPLVDQHQVMPATERDELVAATVIQWLGSPVGQAFLRDCDFVPRRGQ